MISIMILMMNYSSNKKLNFSLREKKLLITTQIGCLTIKLVIVPPVGL